MRLDRLSFRPAKPTAFLAACATLTILVLTTLAFTADNFIDSRQTRLVDRLFANCADRPDALVERLRFAQVQYIEIAPPDPDHPLTQSCGLMAFEPKTFPEDFLKGLVYDVENGIPFYTLIVEEDPKTREVRILNGDETPIYTLKPSPDYDSRWLVRLFRPDTYDAKYTTAYRARVETAFEPSRVRIRLKLIPADYVETYAETTIATLRAALETLLPLQEEGGAPLRSPLATSNIVFDAVSSVSTGIELQISYPDGFTNRLEIYSSSNLLNITWFLLKTNLLTAGTNTLTWVDVSATNISVSNRFYAAGNSDIDTDEDGLVNAREQFLYNTTATNRDSDADGLVDGYSGVVNTNDYPGGAHTNGGAYVEGEMSWRTHPNLFDTDGDGMGDGWEVANGHNPLDPNDPPNVSGTIFYSGRQTGTVWVLAVTSSNSWSTNYCKTIAGLGTYQIPNLAGTSYWIKAWMDSNGNGTNNAVEAWGSFSNSVVLVTNRVTGADITLADPDSDGDTLPDWWEIKYWGGTNVTAGTNDVDGDTYNNLEEYQADTDPTSLASHPWNISGTITYTGPQTGTIYIVACTSSTGWVASQSTTSAVPGTYEITHLPPNTYYYVKAWRDTSGESSNTFWEAWGASATSVFLGPDASGVDITLADSDRDGDTLPDWWEVKYGLDPLNGSGANAAAWWALDEGSGTNVQDSTTNTNNGVLCNMPSNAWTYGVMSNAVSFNGTNAYAQFQDSASLKPNFVSVSLWIKPTQDYTNGTAVFFSKKQPDGATGYRLSYEQGSLSFLVCASGNKTVSLPYSLTNGVWHHVVGTYGGQNHRLYVDGVLRVSTNYVWDPMGSGGTIDQGTTAPRIAASTVSTPSNYFAGVIDEVRIYSGEISGDEVNGVYDLGADPDGDGLSNLDEYRYGACPTISDTDGDGLLDGTEVHLYHTDPTATMNSVLPFTADFESTNGYSAGALNGQQRWVASSGAQVQSIMVKGGSQAVQLGGLSESMSRGLASTDTVVVAETYLYWGTAQLAPPTNLPASATCLVSFDATKGIVGFDGRSNSWVTATNTLLTGQWVKLRVEQNFTAKTWSLWVNDLQKLTGLGFKDVTVPLIRGARLQSGTGESVFADNITISKP